jgi:membrane-bound serine protease (ClpP class)
MQPEPPGKNLVLVCCLALAALIGWVPLPSVRAASAPQGGGPVVVEIGEQLSAGSLSLVRRGIARARSSGGTLVLQLDTPGGNVELMWKLARAIDRARSEKLSVVALVDKHALSAGALLALTCDSIYMTPGSTIGAAMPIQPGGLALPGAVGEKFLSTFRADFRSWAESHSRSGLLAEAMVDPAVEVILIEENGLERLVSGSEWDELAASGAAVTRKATISAKDRLLTLTAEEAVRHGIANGLCRDLPDLIAGKLFMDLAAAGYVRETGAEHLASLLAGAGPLLILLGALFLYLELQTPGFGLFGGLGLLCFALMLFGGYLAGLAGFEHFVLIGLGLALVLVEIFLIPGTLIAGLAGLVCVVLGLIWSQLGPALPLSSALDRHLLLAAFNTTVLWSAGGLLGAALATRLLPHTPLGRRILLAPADSRGTHGAALPDAAPDRGSEALIGALGVTLTPMRPVGKIELLLEPGVEYEGSAVGPALERGVRVRVIERSTGRLMVEAVPEGGAASV